MTEPTIECIIDGKQISCAELEEIKYERAKHVLHEMKSLGAKVVFKGKELSDSEINYLSREQALTLNTAVRSQYTPDEIQKLYKNQIKTAEQMWKEIGRNFVLGKSPVKYSQTYIKATGVNPDLIINGESDNQDVAYETDDQKMKRIAAESTKNAFQMNPEHFFIAAGSNGLYGMETFGMYGEPFPQTIQPGDESLVPIERDDEYPVVSTGMPALLDGTPLYTIPFHQYKPLDNGIEMKLAVVMPESTPDEIIWGHQLHLAIEFEESIKMNAAKSDK